MDFDHISPLLIAIITTLFGGGGFLVALINRKDQKQKERQEQQLEEVQANNQLLTDLKVGMENLNGTLDIVKTEVEDHTHTIAEIKEDQNTIMDKVGLLEVKSRENLKESLLKRFEIFQERGWITPDEKSKWDADFNIYTAQGGNGEVATADKVMQTIPIRNGKKKIFRR